MTQQENDELMYASPEDQAFYLKCVEGLPTLAGLNGTGNGSDGVPLPYGCGPHSVRCLREIIEITNPKSIFEVGFNMGWSAALWLELSPSVYLYSCDISKKQETLTAAKILTERYGNRFTYQHRDELLIPFPIDLIFIDGGHLYEDVVKDIQFGQEIGAQYFAFDDIMIEFGPGVMAAIKLFPELELIKEMGNIALYKNKTVQ